MAFVTKEKFLSKDFLTTYAWLLGGCFLFAIGTVMFAEPYKFAPGGTYGIGIVCHHLFGWVTEYTALMLDIPLLIIGVIILGPRFGIKTVVSTVAIPIFMTLIHSYYGSGALVENDPLLSAIFGGIVYGVGIGMIFKSRATSGGSDIIAMILNKYSHISLGTLVIIVDGIITFSTVIAFGEWKLPMYSWIIIFIEGKVIDMIVEGATVHKTMMIISDKCDLLRDKIIVDLNRSATLFKGNGMYQGKEKSMLYTTVTRREMVLLKKHISEVDPNAFVNVIDSNEILGKGFKNIQE
ncbi:MAG: YitT family protein [Bacteroidota bacterium]|nr:YitT family protein [Bacteroidota bacterium]